MAQPRRPKRSRTAASSAYHDSVPLADDFEVVHAREGKLRKVGHELWTTTQERLPQTGTDSWTSTLEWTPPDNMDYALDPHGEWYDEAVDSEVMEAVVVQGPNVSKKKTRSRVSKRPHVIWKELHRQAYLDELIRWSGRADFRTLQDCPDCVARSAPVINPAQYRCEDCILPDLACGPCCVKRHRLQPFHRIQSWTGSTFVQTTLRTLGHTVQLNHSSMSCENPVPCHSTMHVLHTNGIHDVKILYCGCTRAIPQHLQLLRRRLYPASQIVVKTCATFELLEQLHMLALTTKASTYDFYRALEKLTCNTGIGVPKSRYRALFRMSLQWRHLKLLKRAGRSHDITGVAGTRPGELAIQCPSCPLPGINLPDDWASAPASMKFLYTAIICMDANFRLKNQMVSNYSQDPGLGTGWAYMIPRAQYEAYVLSRADDKDISTCVGFQALAKANSKFSVGLRYTGVGLTVCGRSEMIMPQGVGNLHKGERYANMDFIFGSAMQFLLVAMVLISYDIACQWFINLFKRIDEHWPSSIKPRSGTILRPAIPKLHEPMHQSTNHEMYSLNFIPGVGLSDCECPERVWAPHNALSNSTKTQGPGSRHNALDDHFNFWNWLKYTGLGKSLLRRYKAAVAERNVQAEGHRGLTASLDQGLVSKWEAMCVEWEGDGFPKKKKKSVSFGHKMRTALSESQVRKELTENETKELRAGKEALHATSASSFIVLALELESMQRRLKRMAKEATPTISKEGGLNELRNNFRTRLRAWEQLVPIYMPGLLQFQTDNPTFFSSSESAVHPEDSDVWLPSRLPANVRGRVCVAGLPSKESRLRTAQCLDSLEAIRRILKIKTRMVDFKNKNVRGQREGTRSRTIIDRVHLRARSAAEKYRAARLARLALDGPGDWEKTLRPLEDKDIRGYQDPNQLRQRRGRAGIWEDDEIDPEMAEMNHETSEFELFNEHRTRRDGTGETRRTLSWIWANCDPGSSDDNDDILRVKWVKSRARAARSREEVMLLKEEMRRVLVYLDWKSNWWLICKEARPGVSKDLAEALSSYAVSQAALQASLAAEFRTLWQSPLSNTATTGDSERYENDDEDDDDDDDDDGEDEEEDAGDLDFNDDENAMC